MFINRNPSPNARKYAIFCLYEKAGSTSFKYLLRYSSVYAKKFRLNNLNVVLSQEPHYATTSTKKQFLANAYIKKVPRILITRNPYSRFLSGYVDKILITKDPNFGPPGFQLNDTFETFVREEINYQTNGELHYGDHFRLMSQGCWLPENMTYNYILPLEHMAHWYEPLMEGLHITEYTKMGWNVSTRLYRGRKGMPCHYVKPGCSCNQMFTKASQTCLVKNKHKHKDQPKDQPKNRDNGRSGNITSISSTYQKTAHATDSSRQLERYFNNSKLLSEFNGWIKRDLEVFGYPEWNGTHANEYIRSLEDYPRDGYTSFNISALKLNAKA